MPAEQTAPDRIDPQSLGDYLAVMSKAVFQSGISWKVVENKWPGILEAFHGFDAETVASFTEADLDELTADTRVIRNRRKLDGIVHNASMLGPKVPIAHYPADQFQQVLQVNAFAPFLLTQVLLPVLEKSPSASIVMISSSVGRAGRAYWGAYAVSKFALEGLTQVLADEHSHAAKIRINSLNPGGTRTAMRRAAYPAEDPATLPTPEDRLDVALYLMTDLALGITGEQFDARSWDGPVDKNVF